MRLRVFLALGLVAGLAGCGSGGRGAGRTITIRPGPLGPEHIRMELGRPLAPASTTTPGQTVDGIRCAAAEQAVYHIHAHLQVVVRGQSRPLPGGIGIVGAVAVPTARGPFFEAQRCYYWLHTHASDGIIHIESPIATVFTLGNFFDIWRQPLSSQQVAGERGKVTALVNGRRWTRSPRQIRLTPHVKIQLDVGPPFVPFQPMSFGSSGL